MEKKREKNLILFRSYSVELAVVVVVVVAVAVAVVVVFAKMTRLVVSQVFLAERWRRVVET